MLFLLFRLGTDRFALDANKVAEVLPWIEVTKTTRAIPALAGILNYRGTPVPIIDLCQLTLDRPAYKRLNTRIVIVHYMSDSGKSHLLGLIVERATETVRMQPEAFKTTGITAATSQQPEQVSVDTDGLIQKIDLDRLLPLALRETLFQQQQAI